LDKPTASSLLRSKTINDFAKIENGVGGNSSTRNGISTKKEMFQRTLTIIKEGNNNKDPS
jgi:hypothetical protein